MNPVPCTKTVISHGINECRQGIYRHGIYRFYFLFYLFYFSGERHNMLTACATRASLEP